MVLATDLRLVLALAGAALLFVGAFLPLVSVPLLGSINYFRNGTGDGVIIVLVALAAAVLALRRQYAWLVVPGAAAVSLLGATGITLFQLLKEVRDFAALLDNPYLEDMRQAAAQAFQVQWGLAVMVLGAVCVLGAGVLGWRLLPAVDTRRRRTIVGAVATMAVVALVHIVSHSMPGSASGATASGGASGAGDPSALAGVMKDAELSPTDLENEPATRHGWQVSRDTSVMDGSETVVLRLEADSTYATSYGSRTASLYIRCRENTTDAYVFTGSAVRSEYGEYGRSRVRYRMDDAAPTSTLWDESTSSDALFIPSPIAFVKRLANARRLFVEFTPISSGRQVVTFTVDGLEQQLGAVAAACGWSFP